MSLRPPPTISLRHDWSKELGSKVDRQPEGEVARQAKGEVVRQAKSSQPTPPIPKPICDRSRQLDITPSVIRAQTNLSVVEQIHDRSGKPDKHTVAQDDPEVCHEAETSTLTIRQFVEELRRTWTSKFQDYHILL